MALLLHIVASQQPARWLNQVWLLTVIVSDRMADQPMADGGFTEDGADGEWPGVAQFAAVQDMLDRNAVLIQQIDANHRTRTPDALQRNVVLIRELNANVQRVVEMYSELADSLVGDEGVCTDGAEQQQPAAAGNQQQQQQQQATQQQHIAPAQQQRQPPLQPLGAGATAPAAVRTT